MTTEPFWAAGEAAAESVEAAVTVTVRFDKDMRLECNLKKGETFASTPALRAACEDMRARVSPTGAVLNRFELLGTAIHLHGANRTARAKRIGRDGLTLPERANHGLPKIPAVTGNTGTRVQPVRALVGSAVAPNGGWRRPGSRH